MNYRTIYRKHYGPIPLDEEGRTFDIHHLDGNRKNNDPSNLVALSIVEHYDIHYKQGDWAACLKIASKMKLSPEILSKMASKHNQNRIEKGTHNFLGGEIQRQTNDRRVKDGTHNWLGGGSVKQQLKNGTHTSQRPESLKMISESVKELHKQGLYNTSTHKEKSRAKQLNMIQQGIHHSLMEFICPYCSKKGKGHSMKRWHFDNCMMKEV